MAQAKSSASKEIDVIRVTHHEVTFCVLGTSPLILNRMSEKAKHELLLPRRKSKAERDSTLKHNPYAEFRASAYRSGDAKSPTLLLAPGNSFKAAIRGAALDMPGSASKAQIGRLCYVVGEYLPIFGVPKLFMSVVRSADMNRTPDIRTRVIVPEWAAIVKVRYVSPNLKEAAVANLFAGAGITQGIGDWRTEKGKGDYGQFALVAKDDEAFVRITQGGHRKAQQAALDDPTPYDGETAELLSWFNTEASQRGFGDVSGRDPGEAVA